MHTAREARVRCMLIVSALVVRRGGSVRCMQPHLYQYRSSCAPPQSCSATSRTCHVGSPRNDVPFPLRRAGVPRSPGPAMDLRATVSPPLTKVPALKNPFAARHDIAACSVAIEPSVANAQQLRVRSATSPNAVGRWRARCPQRCTLRFRSCSWLPSLRSTRLPPPWSKSVAS